MWSAASEIGRSTDKTLLIFIGFSFLVLAGITLAMIYFAIRYRASRNPVPGNFEGNLVLEIVWTVIPTIIVLVMFFLGFENFRKIRDIPSDGLTVQVTGQQWVWSFYYPDWNIYADRLFVPVEENIRLEITATMGDVLHSLFIPDFRIKEDAVPGLTTYLWLKAEKPGNHNIFCAEFCGKDHAKMISEMVVVERSDFDKWVEGKVSEKFKPVDMSVALDGKSEEIQKRNGLLLYGTYCASCHGERGTGLGLPDARNFTSLDGWKNGVKITDIFKTISKGIDGTQMRSFAQLSAWDRFALAHIVTEFYGGERPVPTAEDITALNTEFTLDKIVLPQKRLSIDKAMELIIKETVDSSSN
ncbi:MAG: cytochrome c oxidase subunit II [Fibrobacteria bacterium]|nr:cytochrome c oxidase subunit II [Fibrobacteria bacterium]